MSIDTRALHAAIVAAVDELDGLVPEGYQLGVAVPGDARADAEIKNEWRCRLARYASLGRAGARDDAQALPADAADDATIDVIIELFHPATGTRVVRAVSAARLAAASAAQCRRIVRDAVAECERRVERQEP